MMLTAIALVTAHALCDYPLQGDFMAKAKSRVAGIPGVPWYQAMAAHAAIHAGAVAIILGDWRFFPLEFFAHALIDDEKCCGNIDYNTDQALHLACKAVYLAFACLS